MELKNIEFFATPKGKVMIDDGIRSAREYTPADREFTALMLEKIEDFYPDAFNALCELFAGCRLNKDYHDFRMVHRFIRCNFGEYDSTPDIDHNGVFRFEFVGCAQRGEYGECKYCGIICSPKFNSKFTDREDDVMKMFYESVTTEEIADALCISIETVKKHKRNALVKLKLHSLKDFISYASRNKMYESHDR